MARQNVVVVSLMVFFAVLGLATAASSSSPSAAPSQAPVSSSNGGKTEVEAPVNENQIGTTDDGAASPDEGDVAVAGPLGSDSSYGSSGPSSEDSADSGATSFGVSAVAVGATALAASFFYF